MPWRSPRWLGDKSAQTTGRVGSHCLCPPLPQTRCTAGDCGVALHDIPGDLASATQVCLHLTGWRAANTIADDRRFDKVAATYEAVANAAEHSYPAAPEHSHQNTIMTTDLPGTAIAMHWQFDS